MLSRFTHQLKNQIFWPENKPEEGIETDLNWIWQPFETSENLGFAVRVKNIAFAIIESSPDDIPKIPLKLDPRLVIPFQDGCDSFRSWLFLGFVGCPLSWGLCPWLCTIASLGNGGKYVYLG
ncbi:MAG: hypothetical protein J7647_00795 [Cyanobacteria bacterium SBLK]|nr:hypothetical protein [Cyanobacteria bacterium SBLK]